ncbi:MAG: GTPase HflX [Candidatus Hydrogenedentota bacterium]
MKQLERLAKRRTHSECVVTQEMARALTEMSRDIQRQVGLLLNRKGNVTAVIVGDARGLFLPDIRRRGRDRLVGLRLVHTHLGHQQLDDDDLTDLALLRLDLVAAIQVQEDGLPGALHMAHLLPDNAAGEPWQVLPPTTVHELANDFPAMIEALEEEFERHRKPRRAGDNRDRAILVHVSTHNGTVARDSVAELGELARSAGIEVVHELIQRRSPDPKFVMGKGKLKQTLIKAMQLGAEVIVFDLNLSPSQVKALAELTDLKVLDRTQVILDIFAQHATTREGKLQVELAQLRYLLPRLGQKHTAFSRLTGGIGGRGPGETQLEVDRRRARDRIAQLEREVNKLGKRRELRRGARSRKGVPIVSIVGYTNAGKSTLLNSLTQSEVIAEDALFATLNPVSRRLRFPREREVVITDTVGFIRSLPPDLMAAFRTTFEELHEADLILHVIDGACPDVAEKLATVQQLLQDLELDTKPTLVVLNKTDRITPEEAEGLTMQYDGVPVSALDRATFGPLLEELEKRLWYEEPVHT